MFKQLHLEIGLKDALVEMPKFNKWLSLLLRNKEKLEEIAITTVNAECSAIIMETKRVALSLPHLISIRKLSFKALNPTRMTLELAHYFVVVNFEPDPRVPIILGRPFLRTAKALIDLYEEKLTLRVGKEELVYFAINLRKQGKVFAHFFYGEGLSDYYFDKFAEELAPLDSLPPGNDDSTLKKDCHEETFQVYSNHLFEFDNNFKSSNMNPLFEENDKDAEIKSSSSFTLTSPEESEFEAYLERDSIPPGIDLILPPTLEVLSSYTTSLL
ncbi:reverse transcriptase domain-containing protein [Tanacetum coccineum]|uniref:Reverse transcriptase domain-containing protein n=1 Tax=Tanacetum coccineum TaxID=301880 RepID=A0ABQ5EQ17_9ASTR